MNKRMINLIHELMKKECTVGELADQFNVSQRTIRNDMKAVNELLKSNGFHELTLLRGEKSFVRRTLNTFYPVLQRMIFTYIN